MLVTTNDYIETVNFYDDRYRLIQSKVVNYKDGEDVISSQYDFAGRLRKTHLLHSNPAADITSTKVVQEYSYDHAGRLLTVTHKAENDPTVTLLSNTYNELGELVHKDLADGYEDIDYTYNIRGWLTKINNLSDGTQKLFEMDLEYDNAPADFEAYNGNIGATAWKNPYESMVNRYNYVYDEMNRLTKALYSNGGASNMGFDVTGLLYDLNGNIKTLQRKGNNEDGAENEKANVTIDNLSYTYAKGNQLSKVTDSSGKTAGFRDGTNQTTEYLYDENGNMKEDRNKGITSITYNHLNLPKKVTFSASKYIEYTYDASGAKLSQKTVDGSSTKISDYVGGFVYENNELQFLQHDEGRVVAKRNETGIFDGFQYQYHLKDHLGNVRATFKTEQDPPDTYLATLENDAATKAYEQEFFSRYGEVTRINADIFDHTDTGTAKTYSMRLNGTVNEKYGLAKSLSVKPGDQVSAEVWVKFIDPDQPSSNYPQSFIDLMDDFEQGIGVVEGATAGTESLPNFVALAGGHGEEFVDAPKAYLNVLVTDLNYKLIGNPLFKQVPADAWADGYNKQHKRLNIDDILITEPGYVYIYLSNENGTPVEVFFDDFKVTHTNTNIVQKDDYYPFGMSFNSYTRPGSVGQKLKFNGKERDETTGWDDYGARMYQAELGRWGCQDIMAEKYYDFTPYSYVGNMPTIAVDPNGMEIVVLGGDEYKRQVLLYLFNLALNSEKGAELVNKAFSSKRQFVIAEIEGESEVSEYKNYDVVNFDLSKAEGEYSAENGRKGKNLVFSGETKLAHELSHFLNPDDGLLLNENGYSTRIRASEVKAVEEENIVRKELGLPERTHYGGMEVYGKQIKESKYANYFELIKKNDYAKSSQTNTRVLRNSWTENLSIDQVKRKTYSYKGRYIEKFLINKPPSHQTILHEKRK